MLADFGPKLGFRGGVGALPERHVSDAESEGLSKAGGLWVRGATSRPPARPDPVPLCVATASAQARGTGAWMAIPGKKAAQNLSRWPRKRAPMGDLNDAPRGQSSMVSQPGRGNAFSVWGQQGASPAEDGHRGQSTWQPANSSEHPFPLRVPMPR